MSLPADLQELLSAAAYPHPVERVQLVETPISWVLLTGSFAYKIKRPVRLEYLDQRTPARRAELCAEELRLNRRFAPELYLDVRPIRRIDGRLRVGAEGGGTLVEPAVCMRQFDRSQELDRLVQAGAIRPEELADFGQSLAAIHAGLETVAATDPWGTPERVAALVLANLEQCQHASAALDTAAEIAALRAPLQQALSAAAPFMAQRRAAGRVRECHGDLHTRNIVRQGGRLLAFDCVEFEPAFRWIDVADDIAFLSADLQTLGAPLLAWSFLQAYFTAGGDWQACRLLPLYQAHRALVRAKVAALSAGEDPAARPDLLGMQRAYLEHAMRVLGPARPCVLLMSGVSGSGKTWLAARLAPLLRALHLRSDVERKRRAGLRPLAATESGLQRALYAPEATATLYRQLLTDTADIVAGGYSVIVDATFLRADDRQAWRAFAAAAGLPYLLIHCTAPLALLRQRIEQRRAAAADASEADLEVLDWQRQRTEPFAAGERATLIEADTAREDVVAEALQAVRAALGSAGTGS